MCIRDRIIPVKISEDVHTGDNIIEKIISSNKSSIDNGDVIVISQKIISKHEGRVVELNSVIPSELAVGIASAYDKDPNRIVVSDTRRDAPLNNSDSFSFIIDTFKDFQTGYLFGTNAAGVEFDAQITGGGEGGSISRRFSIGSGGGFNVNWDAVWEVKTTKGDFGWSAEFAIPFKSLRYKEDKNQSWGINFERVIARKKEESHWAPIPRQFTMTRLVSAGTINNVNVPVSRNIKIMPYVISQNNQVEDGQSTQSSKSDFG